MSALDLDALERLALAYADAHAAMLADDRSAQAWLDDNNASKALAAHYGGEYTSPKMCADVLALITRLRAAEARTALATTPRCTGGAVTDRDPWVAIVRAERAGRGVQLSWAEVQRMVRIDDAIRSAAETCTTECVCDIMRGGAQCETCEARHV